MRKLIALVVLLCGFMPVLWAADGCDQHLSREEFRAKQKAFIIEQAGLNKEEAAKFFPVYFELQDKKKKLNDESWDLMRKGKDDKTTEAQYAEINEKVAQMNSKLLAMYAQPNEKGLALLKNAMERFNLSARAYDRILKVARTIADLEGVEQILPSHLAEAISYRNLDRENWAG